MPLPVKCDCCDTEIVGAIYKAVCARPSDPIWRCSVMWSCKACAPSIGGHTDTYWERKSEREGWLFEG